MLKSLEIGTYSNGYNIDHINCIDLSIAGATGYYFFENYYYYCFYYTFFNNWSYCPDEDGDQLRNFILNKMGLELRLNKVTNASQLMPLIKRNINEQNPVLLYTKYNHLFYANQYLSNEDRGVHVIFVSDYDTQKPIVAIREYVHVRQGVASLVRGDLFARLQLNQEMLINIWKKSNRDFQKEKSNCHNTVLSIERIGEPAIKNYYDLIRDIVANYGFEKNKLIPLIRMMDQNLPANNLENFNKLLTRTFNAPMTIIFDLLEKVFDALNHDKKEQEQFRVFKFKYLNFRKDITAKLMAVLVRGKVLSTDDQNSLIQQINAIDAELYGIMKELAQKSQQQKAALPEEPNGLINYALEATAMADSALQPPSQALNATDDFWVSKASSSTHWLQVNLNRPMVIRKLRVKHSGDPELNTRDYKIQGSNNGNEWFDLVIVKGNGANETSHEIEPVKYQYVRLYITDPSFTDNLARIRQFEIWGKGD